MKNLAKPSKPVAGVIAPAVRPTLLGAALIAAMTAFPIIATILLVDLLLL